MRIFVPHGSAVTMPVAVVRQRRAGLREPCGDGVEGIGVGRLEREPGEPGAVLVAHAGAGAVPDIAADVMMIAPR